MRLRDGKTWEGANVLSFPSALSCLLLLLQMNKMMMKCKKSHCQT